MRLGVISDVHVSLVAGDRERWHGELDLEGAHERLAAGLAFLLDEAVDVIVIAGDLTHHGDTPSIERVLSVLEGAGLPVFVVPGNHDSPEPDALAAAIAARAPGNVRLATPAGTLIAAGIRLAGRGEQPAEEPYLTAADDTSSWGDDLVIWLTHFPVLSLSALCDDAGLLDAGDAGDIAEAERQLAGRTSPTVVLTGHFHVRHAELRGTLLQLTMAALVEAPGDVAVIDLERDPSTSLRRRVWESDRRPAERVPVLAPLDETFVLDRSKSWARALAGVLPDLRIPARGVGILAFDWNGTVVDDATAAWRATRAVLESRGLPGLSRAAFSDAFCLPLTSFFDSFGVEDALLAADEWNTFMAGTESDLMSGARSVLEDLHADGVVLGVVSAASEAMVTHQVARYGLSELFAFVQGGAPNKWEVLSRLGRQAPGRVAFLGDTEYDVDEARNAGVRAWAFAGGYRPADALRRSPCERLISSFDELRELVRDVPARAN